MTKRYYWLRLKDDFFERDDIKIIESMENGKDYIIFLLKLKLKSLEYNGYLRMTNAIPYDEKTLSIITNTDIDVVRTAIKVFIEFDLIDFLDNGTIYMRCIETLIGSESESAERVREHRKRKLLHCNNNVIKSNTEKEIKRKSNSKNKYIDEILEIWNNCDIVKHNKEIVLKNFKNRHYDNIKFYGIDTVKKAIELYAEVYKNDIYFFSYKWSLWDFIGRQNALTNFLPEMNPLQNYLTAEGKMKLEKEKQLERVLGDRYES